VVDIFLGNKDGDVDELLSSLLQNHLNDHVYDNVLIPVSIGKTLSDFLGLRFSTHIRTTDSKNQLANIYIYTFTGLKDLMGNECFNILNIKGIQLIDFSQSGFNLAIENKNTLITENQLSSEIAKLKLNIPDNYMDNHSIANIWAMYRWSSILGDLSDLDNELKNTKTKINTNLYYKYLKTLHGTNKIKPINLNQLKINQRGKILFIDDEANKGWSEIFCTLLEDNNDGVVFDYIDDLKFEQKSQDEIIQICIDEIKQIENYPDIVILDLRLHQSDFESKSISEFTGFKILQEIKRINPGIQVIIFSATNKVWNLQALLKAGADDFIIKEGFENSVDIGFTEVTISKFISTINKSLDRKFLKSIFEKCNLILDSLRLEYIEEDHNYSFFIKDLISQIHLIENSVKNIELDDSMTLDIVFLNCYNFLEKFKNHYLREIGYKIVLGDNEIEMNRYNHDFNGANSGRLLNKGKFVRNNKDDNPSWFNCMVGLFVDYFELVEIDSIEIKNLNKMKDNRNNYIHNNKSSFTKKDLIMVIDLCVMTTSGMKE
jgi:CheY-like chemotaxis protein